MNDKPDENEKRDLELTNEKTRGIYKWTESRFEMGSNVFPDLKTAIEFKALFFTSRNDIEIYCLSFSETDAGLLLDDFAEGKNTTEFNHNNGNFELRKNLIKKTTERDDID